VGSGSTYDPFLAYEFDTAGDYRVEVGSSATLREVLLVHNHATGISTVGEGAEVGLQDVVVRGTRASAFGSGGSGVQLGFGARVDAKRLVVDENSFSGIHASSEGTEAVLEDALVRGTLESENGVASGGIQLSRGARLSAQRLVVEANRYAGIYATDAGTELVLSDLAALDTECQTSSGAQIYVYFFYHVDR